MRAPLRIALMFIVTTSVSGPASAADRDPDTTARCPGINFSGFSLGADNVHVAERMWWDTDKRSYFIQGPVLAMRFSYPDQERSLSELKSDLGYVYAIPVDRMLTRMDQDVCRPKVEISAQCQMARVPGALSEPALIVTAQSYDECNRQPVQNVVRVKKLIVGARTGIEFAFYNSFNQSYDSGMDVFDGENVFNMGYRLK